MKTLNATEFKEFTPEHDAIMKTDLVPVFGAFDLYADEGFSISVKVPHQFTFVKFESGWDQDNYIHNNKAELVADQCGFAYKTLQDYPRYTNEHCKDALRYFFTSVSAAGTFIDAIQIAMDIKETA
jgi:hypothetical protein